MTALDPLRFVKFYAATKHGSQTYSNGMPYTHHLAAVEAVLRRFGVEGPYTQELLEAAWLHDVVEDTPVKVKDIAEMFGPVVAALVAAVTNEPGENRKVRHALTYPKIRNCVILGEPAGKWAARLKLADRIANVEAGGSLVQMYAKEYDDFRRNLFTSGENLDMWARLDEILGH